MTAIDTFKTPLRQLTGTCYFNSVLNGILADPKLSRIFFYKVYGYREELRLTDPTRYADFINTSGEALCPHPRFADKALREDPSDPRFKEMRYIVMKYFYGFLCKGTEILEESKTMDIADRMAKVIRKPMTETTTQDTGGRGNPFKIVLNILRTLYGSEFWDKVAFVEDMAHVPNEKAEILIHTRDYSIDPVSQETILEKEKSKAIYRESLRKAGIDKIPFTVSVDMLMKTIRYEIKNYYDKIKRDVSIFNGFILINYLKKYTSTIYDIIATKEKNKRFQFIDNYNQWDKEYDNEVRSIWKQTIDFSKQYKKNQINRDDYLKNITQLKDTFNKYIVDAIESYISLIQDTLRSEFESGEIQITSNNLLYSKALLLLLKASGHNVDDIKNIEITPKKYTHFVDKINHNHVESFELKAYDILNDSAKNYDFSFISIVCGILGEGVRHAVIGKYYEGQAYIIDSNYSTPTSVIDWKELSDNYSYDDDRHCAFQYSVHVRSDLPSLSMADLALCHISDTTVIQHSSTNTGGSQKRIIVYGGKKYRIQTGSKGGRYILVEGKKKYI